MAEHLGDNVLVYLEWSGSGDPMVVRIPEGRPPGVGERQTVSLPPEHCHLFAADGSAW